MEERTKNAENFAFRQAKSQIEKAEGEDLQKKVELLQKELVLAEALESGKGKKAPALGLKVEQYNQLNQSGAREL